MTHIIRLGTQAEKEYFERASPWYDEVLLNANLVEATAGATSLFVFQLEKPYFIDPVTYAFAVDPLYIQSEDAAGEKRFKRTFKNLAFRYGITKSNKEDPPRLSTRYFSDAGRLRQFCELVLAYQRDKCNEALRDNEEFFPLEEPPDLRPTRLMAPYFYSAHDPTWREINGRLVTQSSELAGDLPLWAVICMDALVLDDDAVVNEVAGYYAQLPCAGVGIWLTDLDESSATATQLIGVRRLVSRLVESGKEIINLYGGYFSALLRFDGLTGFSHGVGYGERRDVVPVVGGGLPPAKYYLPPIHERIYLEDLLRLATGLSAQEFLDQICRCAICSGLIRPDLDHLLNEYSRTVRKPFRGGYRNYADPIVYRYTRFHFLHNRHLEVTSLNGMGLDAALSQLARARNDFAEPLGANQIRFLHSWERALTTTLN